MSQLYYRWYQTTASAGDSCVEGDKNDDCDDGVRIHWVNNVKGGRAPTALLWAFAVVAFLIDGAACLKDVSVVIPQAARSMDTVSLQCKYNLQGEPLYTVKWYKGQREFFRYIPKELPSTQVFPLPGINVDLSKSTPNVVVLRNVQPEVTGMYKCEVSSDAPNFYTFMVSGYMYVIDTPTENPIITLEKDNEISNTIRGNCSSPPSYPAANITWRINGKMINASSVKHLADAYSVPRAPRKQAVSTVSNLDMEVDDDAFIGGKVRLQCISTIFSVYRGETEVEVEERARPRPSSELRTRDASGAQFTANQLNRLLLVLFCLLSICR